MLFIWIVFYLYNLKNDSWTKKSYYLGRPIDLNTVLHLITVFLYSVYIQSIS